MDKKLIKNKVCSIIFLLLGLVVTIYDKDATFFIFILVIAVMIFFSKESWFI